MRLRRYGLVVLALCSVFAALPAWGDNAPPVQTFYVPMPEDDYLDVLETIENGTTWIPAGQKPADPMYTYVTISVFSDNTILYYDHWENGFDASINNPLNIYHPVNNPGGTQIWGDDDPSNGIPPGFADDVLDFGTVIRLENSVVSTNRTVINFDGGDKIASTKPIAVTWAGWASGSATLFAGALEVFDTTFWGAEYISPVGEDIATDIPTAVGEMFQYTGLSIMAGVGGATIQIDANADGVFETTNTLAEGEAYLVNGGVNVGGRVISDRPVQVELLTGDIYEGYESRFFRLLPVNYWTSSSTTPVSTPDPAQATAGSATTVWLYNPATNAIAVDYITRDGGGNLVTSSLSVPGGSAGGYLRQVIPDGYGARFINTNDLPFYALATVDSAGTTLSGIGGPGQNRTWDWGFTLVPEGSLTKQVLVGLGIGRDPTSATNPNENGAPIWVTPIGNGDTNVTIYVDYDSDPSTGPLTDPNGNQYDVSYTARELDILKIYRTNSTDQSGLLIYLLDDDVKMAAAWGSDPLTATAGAPGLDMGTGIPPLPEFVANKRSFLLVDEDNDGYISPGDVLQYRIVIDNTGRQPVTDLVAEDLLPASLTYITNTTFFVSSANVTNSIADDIWPSTPFPLDNGGYTITNESALPVGGTWEIGYDTRVSDFTNLPPGTVDLENQAIVGGVGLTTSNTVTTPLYARIGDFVWWDEDGDGFQSAGETGINGAIVNLLTTNGTPVLDEIGSPITAMTTNDTFGNPGWYQLTGVLPGTYIVKFEPPSGYIFATPDADGNGEAGSTNSNASIPDGFSGSFTVEAGETVATIDAGLIEASTIGDFVWWDADGDGLQDPGEIGLNGVTVNLLDTNGVAVLDANSAPISAVTTNNVFGDPGYYRFEGLYPGDYIVAFVLPPDAIFTTQDADSQGVPGELNSVADVVSGRSDVFTLGPEENLTSVDAGLLQAELVLTKVVSQPVVEEGSTVLYTIAVSNAGPTLATSVVVHDPLTNGITYVTNSASQGSYNSGSGDWTLGTLPVGSVATLPLEVTVDIGTQGSGITNVSQVTASDMPDPISSNNQDDVAIYVSALRITKASDVGISVIPGESITYTIVVTNVGAVTHTGVEITDVVPAGTTYDPGSVSLDIIPAQPDSTNSVYDTFSSQTYSNNNGSMNWNGSWQETGESDGPLAGDAIVGTNGWAQIRNNRTLTRSVNLSGVSNAVLHFVTRNDPSIETDNVRDEFSAQSYSNNDGSLNWNGAWSEGDPAGTAGPVGDYVGISGDRLTFHWAYVNDEWASRSADFTGYDSAEFRFDWETVGLDAGETISVLVSSNGTDFVELEQLGGTGSGSRAYDISSYISATTTIRFENLSENWESGEYAYFDNVEIVGSRSVLAGTDEGYVEFSADGDIWNPVYAVTGMVSGSVTSSVDVTSFATADSAVRFRTDGYTNANAVLMFDDVEVVYESPFGVTAVSDPPLIVNGLSLPSGVSAVVSFSATVDDPLDQSLWSITNTATVNSDLLPGPLPATVVDEVIPVDLGVGKSASPTVVNEGDSITFSVSLTNFSSVVNATGVEVTDVLPAGFAFVSATPSVGSYNSTNGIWTVGAVSTQGVETLVLDVTATNGTAGQYLTNVTTISAAEQADTNLLNNTAQAVVLVRGADLALTKTVDNPAPNEESEVTYTITVENLGPSDTTGVTVFEPLTNGITYVSHSASLGSYNSGAGVWTVGALGTGDVVTLSITVEVDIGTIGTSITNLAKITNSDLPDPNPANDTDDATISVSGLRVTKVSDVVDFAYPGSNITYTIVVTNLGATAYNGIDVVDHLPSGTTFVPGSLLITGLPPVTNTVRDEFNAIAYTNNDGTVNWANDWQEIGESNGANANAVRVQTLWGNDYVLRIYNSSRAAWRQVDLSGATNATLTFDYRIVGFSDGNEESYLSVSTNGGSSWVTLETWTANVGSTTAANYDLTPYLSSNTAIQFSNAAANGAGEGPQLDNIEIAFVSPSGNTGAPPNLASDITLPPGGAFSITFEVTVDDPSVLTQVVNTVSVTSDEQPVPVTATVVDPVPYADLGVVKTVDDGTPDENDTIVYTVTITNHGPTDTTGVEVTDLLPAGVTYVTNTASVGSYHSGTGIWTIGDLDNGDSATLTLTATVDPGTAGTAITNTATITGNDLSDPNPDNDADGAEITVIAVDIGVGKSVSPPVPFEKEQLVYTVAVTNFGPDTATGVVVTDELPSALTYVSHTASQGSYVPGSGLWTIGTMTPMQVETLTLTAYVPEGTSGLSITNTATVTGVHQVDTNALNDTASVVVEPEEPPLSVTKTSDVTGLLGAGDTITYTIVVTNQSSQAQTGVDVIDPVPAGVSLVPGSVNIFGPVNTNSTLLDRFDAISFTNNNGDLHWAGNWIESEGDGPSSGDTRVTTDPIRGPSTVRFGGGSRTLAREANLDGYTNATLSLVYRRDGLVDAADLVSLQVSSNGVSGTWTTVATYAGPATDGSYSSTSVDITPYISTNTAIRFSSPAGNTPGNRVWFDDVEISVPARLYADVAGGNPPNLVEDGTLDPGEALTVTYQVTVDNPVTVTQVCNTATVQSDQMSTPVSDSVCAPVDPAFLASVGDRVWLDENADGVQDAGESGIPNITIEILNASNVVVATTVTDQEGTYLVTGLASGTYTVRVATNSLPAGLRVNQTYDPDVTTNHQTTVTLSMGEVYRDADFGYNWTPASDVFGGTGTGAIGDRVWIDANGDGVQDPGEPGLAGVTVTLYNDAAGNGLYTNVYATTTTDAAGNYIFDGLPAGAYVVAVTAPGGYTQTGDPDDFGAVASDPDNKTTMPIILAPGDTFVNADFGYQPANSSDISGTVYFDENEDEDLDPGDGDYGISGVTVALRNNADEVIATTRTDANGFYQFTGLPSGTYTVWVNDTGNLLDGLAQTEDQDATKDSRHTLSVNGSTDVEDIDFGYHADSTDGLVGEPLGGDLGAGPNTIGGTIWEDRNADGTLAGSETNNGLAGITVRLTDTNGNWIATAVTDVDGDYEFTGVTNGTYLVRVTDDANLLNGWWHSDGPNDGSDNNSQIDPYTVTVTGGETNTTGDFGYYYEGSGLGNRVWNDANGNGIQDAGEIGIEGVTLKLEIVYTSGITNIVTTLSDTNGFYSFGNLLLDENQDGTNAASPMFMISVINPGGGFNHTVRNAPGAEAWEDSDQPLGVVAATIQGVTGVSLNGDDPYAPSNEVSQAWYDFGFTVQSTLAVISAVRARVEDGVAIISWDVAMEIATVGYYLERWHGNRWLRVSESLLYANPFEPLSRSYEQADTGVQPFGIKRYRIVELDEDGNYLYYGPYDLHLNGGRISYETWEAGLDWGDADSSRNADPDGDGRTNWQEYLAGTNPLVPNALARVRGMERAPAGGFRLVWPSHPGHTYAIEMTMSLMEPFLAIATDIPDTAPENVYLVPLPPGHARRAFYRVVAE